MKGHWRKLGPNQEGKDQYGSKVRGKTWVRRGGVRKQDLTLSVPKELKEVPSPTEPKTQPGPTPAEKDLILWNIWNTTGDDDDLVKLMNRFNGSVARIKYTFKDAPVPPSVIDAACNVAVMEAIKSYDPKGGSTLNQWVNGRLKGVGKVVGKYQNVGKIPEHRRIAIAKYRKSEEDLTEKLGHPPSAQALAEDLGWSITEVTRMGTELSRRDLIASQNFEADEVEHLADEAFEKRVFRRVYYSLEDEHERLVFEYTAGYNGKPELSAGEIAKKLSIHPSKVSRIRNKIGKMFEERGL